MKLFSSGKHIILALTLLLFSVTGTAFLSFYNRYQLDKFSDNSKDNVDWAYYQIERLYNPLHILILSKNNNYEYLNTAYELWASTLTNIKGPSFSFLLNYYPSENSREEFIYSINHHFNEINRIIKNIDDIKKNHNGEWTKESTDYLVSHDLKILNEVKTLSVTANQKISLYWANKQSKISYVEAVESGFILFDVLCFLIFSGLLFHYIFSLKKITNELIQSNSLITVSRDETLSVYQSKAMFLAKISHELKTPLNSIIGFSDILEHDLDNPLNIEQQKSLKYISMSAKMVSQLVHEILDFNSMESGKVEIHPSKFNVVDLIEESENIVHQSLLNNSNSLIYSKTPVFLFADFLRTKQILINLLTNAIKYGNPNSEIVINVFIDDTIVFISVENEGNVISHENSQNIFQPFFRGNYENSEINGNGIGLSISKKLAQLMQGDLTFESSDNITKFIISLPWIQEVEKENNFVSEYLLVVSQHQRYIDAIISKLRDFPKVEPLVVPDVNFAKDIIEYSNVSHVIYTEGVMTDDFDSFIKSKSIDSVKFDLDLINSDSISLKDLNSLLKRWF